MISRTPGSCSEDPYAYAAVQAQPVIHNSVLRVLLAAKGGFASTWISRDSLSFCEWCWLDLTAQSAGPDSASSVLRADELDRGGNCMGLRPAADMKEIPRTLGAQSNL